MSPQVTTNGNQKQLSNDFIAFTHSIGWPVTISKHPGWLGGYACHFDSTNLRCETVPYFANRTVEVIFHLPYVIRPRRPLPASSAIQQDQSAPSPIPQPTSPNSLLEAAGRKLISDDLVNIIWIEEDFHLIGGLPHKIQQGLAADSTEGPEACINSLVNLFIHPLPDLCGLYLIRIILSYPKRLAAVFSDEEIRVS
jgi:hypothetical protein